MQHICGEPRLLGSVLIEQGAATLADVELALKTQIETGDRLGKILVELGLVCSPALARAVAGQAGVELEHEHGFGTGLRSEIERWHGYRRAPGVGSTLGEGE